MFTIHDRAVIVDVSSQRTGFDSVRVRIGLEVETGTVGKFCLGVCGFPVSFQKYSVLTFIHVPPQLCRLDTNILAKQMKDIPHRHDVSGVGLIKLVINIRY